MEDYSEIKEIQLPNTIKRIHKWCFNSFSLKSLSLPEGVYLEEHCVSPFAPFVTTYSNVYYLGTKDNPYYYALGYTEYFHNTQDPEIRKYDIQEIHPDCKVIQEYAFEHARFADSIVLPEGITEIPSFAFKNASGNTIYLPDSIKVIGWGAFEYSGFEHIDLGNGVEIITYNSFAFANIKEITLPSSLKNISNCSFCYCDKLTSVEISEGFSADFSSFSFYNCVSLCTVTIRENVSNCQYMFYSCPKLVEIINYSSLPNDYPFCSEGNPNLIVKNNGESAIEIVDDFVFYTNGEHYYLMSYIGNETLSTLPKSYKGHTYEIYDYALCYCKISSCLVIPEGVTGIGSRFINSCETHTEIIIPDSITYCGDFNKGQNNYYLFMSSKEKIQEISTDTEKHNYYYYSETEISSKENLYWHYNDEMITVYWIESDND